MACTDPRNKTLVTPERSHFKIVQAHLAHRFTSSGGEIRGEAWDIGSLITHRNPICGACPG